MRWRGRKPLRGVWGSQYFSSFARNDHPVVDCSVLLSNDMKHPKRPATLVAIREALETRGYFYASGVASLPADYITEVATTVETAPNHCACAAFRYMAIWKRPIVCQ
jgi:hypothetical protein